MSAAIGAALKKIAVALLTDKKVLKAIGMTVLVLIVALLLPLMAMMAILSGDIELDTDELMDRIEANLSANELAMLTTIEDTMEAIDTALTDAEMPSRVGEAQALYIIHRPRQSHKNRLLCWKGYNHGSSRQGIPRLPERQGRWLFRSGWCCFQ